MDCPGFTGHRSPAIGRRRLEKAAAVLGHGTTTRLLCFALYLMGFSRRDIARVSGYRVAGLKSLVDRIMTGGLVGFADRPRVPPASTGKPSSVQLSNGADGTRRIALPGSATMVIPGHDPLAAKVVSVVLVNSGIIAKNEGAALLGYTPKAFNRLLKKYGTDGSAALIDRRVVRVVSGGPHRRP